MSNIYQQIWDADQNGNGIQPIGEEDRGDPSRGYVRVVRGPASEDLRILQDVHIPRNKLRTYNLVRRLFDNYALSESDVEVETREERDEVHELLEALVDTPPMLVARQYVERASGGSISLSHWYAILLEMWFRRFSQGGDPDLSGFEHVLVGEQEGAKVQGYHFWYKYYLDDTLASQIDGNPFPGLADDRIQYNRSFETVEQRAFPESVTISYRWNAPDYDRKAIRPLTKRKGGFFVGCSVEGLMAMGTVRAHVAVRAPKEAVINGARYSLKVFRSPNAQHVRTFYPVFLGTAPAGAIAGAFDVPTFGRTTIAGAIRIVAALVNPAGTDAGRETVTLMNVGPNAETLEAWRLIDKNRRAYEIPKVTLAPGCAFTVEIPVIDALQLSNKGGELRLVDRDKRTVHVVSYSWAQASREGESVVF